MPAMLANLVSEIGTRMNFVWNIGETSTSLSLLNSNHVNEINIRVCNQEQFIELYNFPSPK